MGILYDYFAAASDDAAAETIDLPGGPGGAEPFSPELQAAIRVGDRSAMRRLMMPQVRLSEHGLEVLSVKGIEPCVQMAALEQLLTGVSIDEVFARERSAKNVAIHVGGERMVMTLTDQLQTALSAAPKEQLDAVAVLWSQTEEFSGMGEPEVLAHFLHELSALARNASSAGNRLYCWVCL